MEGNYTVYILEVPDGKKYEGALQKCKGKRCGFHRGRTQTERRMKCTTQ